MKNSLKKIPVLTASDLYILVMLIIYTCFAVIYCNTLDNAPELIILNLSCSAIFVGIAFIGKKFAGQRWFFLLRRLYIFPFLFLVYSQIQFYIREINPLLYDDILISWDKWLLGVNPTQWLMNISNPVLTEYLQFSYITYFFLPLFLGIEIHFRKSRQAFNDFAGLIVFSLFFSYLLYLIMPAVGPRFFLHDFATTDLELPGIFLAEHFRAFVNWGGGLSPGDINPHLIVNRDCMPSGHTWISLMTIVLAFRNNSRIKYLILVIGSSLIFSTVYLRYHYVVDVIAGITLCLVTLRLEPSIRKFLQNKKLISG